MRLQHGRLFRGGGGLDIGRLRSRLEIGHLTVACRKLLLQRLDLVVQLRSLRLPRFLGRLADSSLRSRLEIRHLAFARAQLLHQRLHLGSQLRCLCVGCGIWRRSCQGGR